MGGRGVALILSLALLACSKDEAPEGVSNAASRPPTEAPEGLTDLQWGERLFRDYGCVGCHTVHGARAVGGRLDGLWGDERTLSDGRTVTADADYVRESIVDPDAKRVAGASARMISYEGVLNQAQVDALVAYIRSLR